MIDVGYDGDVADVVYVFGQSTHSTMFTRCGLLTLICIASCAGQEGEGRIVGRVFDQSGEDNSGAPLPGAVVLLTPDDGRPTLQRVLADARGQFVLDNVKPGIYAVRMWAPCLREKAAHGIVVTSRDTVDEGTVRLEFAAGCSLKHMFVDARRIVELGCGLDLDPGRSRCDRNSKADLQFVRGQEGALYLRPLNGALMALPGTTNESCQAGCICAKYSDTPMRLDGFAHNRGLCVLTHKRRFAQVFASEEAEPGSVELVLWYVIERQR